MKKIAIYGLVGASILASSSSVFAQEASQKNEIINDYSKMTEHEIEQILEFRVERLCQILGKDINQISKQEILEVVNTP